MHVDEPLIHQEWFNYGAAFVAVPDVMADILGFHQEAVTLQVGDHLLASRLCGQATILFGRLTADLPFSRNDLHLWQGVTGCRVVIIRVVRRS